LVDCQEWSFSEAANPFKSVERHALSLGVQIRHERFDQRLAAELNGLASEPDVLLFAPE
jgi:hypothetical protein